DDARLQRAGVHHVVAALGVDGELVAGRLASGDLDGGRQPGDGHAGGRAAHPDHVRPVGAVDDDGVGRAVAGAAPRRGRQVEVDLRDPGAGQVVDGDGIDSAQGDEVDLLRAGDVHDDAGHVPCEAQPGAVGRQLDLLGDVGPVELQGVQPVLPLD